MDYERKRGTQYYEEIVPDPDDVDLTVTVVKRRRVTSLEWEGPDGQIYRAPDTPGGRDSLDVRRRKLLGFTQEEIDKEVVKP